MTRTRSTVFCSILALAALGGCSRNPGAKTAELPSAMPQPAAAATPAGPMASGTVVETMDAAEYTYLRVKTSSGDIWAAAGKFKVKTGDKVLVPLDMPMENFHSSTLKRTFPTVYFTSRIFHEGDPDLPAQAR